MKKEDKREVYRCEKCGEIAEYINGFIYDRKWHPENIGCDCYGSMFIKVNKEELN